MYQSIRENRERLKSREGTRENGYDFESPNIHVTTEVS